MQAAKLLLQLADEQGKSRTNPLRAKKIYVLAALLIEEHIKDRSNALMGLAEDNEDSRAIENAWKGAEAYHFLLLAHRQIYLGDFDAAVKTAPPAKRVRGHSGTGARVLLAGIVQRRSSSVRRLLQGFRQAGIAGGHSGTGQGTVREPGGGYFREEQPEGRALSESRVRELREPRAGLVRRLSELFEQVSRLHRFRQTADGSQRRLDMYRLPTSRRHRARPR